MYIELEEKDYREIAQMIADSDINSGSEYVNIDGLEFEVQFTKDVEGYYEDNYDNGTGAWVCTDAVVHVYDVSCENVKVFFNNSEITYLAQDYLKS